MRLPGMVGTWDPFGFVWGQRKSALDGEVEGAVVAMIGLMLTDSVVSMTERETYLAVDFNTSKQVA